MAFFLGVPIVQGPRLDRGTSLSWLATCPCGYSAAMPSPARSARTRGASAATAGAHDRTLTSTDQLRRVTVVAAELFCIVGTLVGTGVLGQRVEESAGGALSDEATLVAPAGPAFSIWTPIYLGLLAYTVWQFLPRNASRERTRRTGWLAAASMALNATWLLVTQADWVWASVVVIVALLVNLLVLVSRLGREPASGVLERIVVDGTFGLYLGWVTVATAANLAAAVISSDLDLGVDDNPFVAVAVVAVVATAGVLLARRLGGRWAVGLALAWGFGWIAFGRLADEPRSTATAIAAGAAAVVVLFATAWYRRRRPQGRLG